MVSTFHSPGDVLPHACAAAERLCQQLDEDRLDAAIEGGLMQFVPCTACSPHASRVLGEVQERLRQAWTARDRHLARNARLASRAEARAAERSPWQDGEPGLPSAAAAALARARARAKPSGGNNA